MVVVVVVVEVVEEETCPRGPVYHVIFVVRASRSPGVIEKEGWKNGENVLQGDEAKKEEKRKVRG
eukprot:109751-Hanusia_phi.AAC.1